MVRIGLLIGCTATFCVLGLVAGVLAAKLLQHSPEVRGDDLLMTILVPPAVGAGFGFFVGSVSAFLVRWNPKASAGDGESGRIPPRVE
jgi:hypothetical protein